MTDELIVGGIYSEGGGHEHRQVQILEIIDFNQDLYQITYIWTEYVAFPDRVGTNATHYYRKNTHISLTFEGNASIVIDEVPA